MSVIGRLEHRYLYILLLLVVTSMCIDGSDITRL